jgi:ubiquitin-activating enzyme E1
VEFSASDPLHLDYIVAVANARAKIYGIDGNNDRAHIEEALSRITVAEFVPRDGVKIAASEAEMKEDTPRMNTDEQCDAILAQLPSADSLGSYRMGPIEFDKDDDSHMEVIVATSNLRARNYKIPEADMHRSRFIAGKIIPAIATTTALVTGLVCFEFVKVIQNKPLDNYKNGFVNLALPLFTFSEPIAPKTVTSKLKGEEYKWTAWDRIDVDMGNVTLREFLDYFSNDYECEISMLSYGATILYAMYSQKSRSKERMAMKMSQLVETVTKKPIDANLKYLILEVCATDADDEDLELPYIRFHYRK